MNNHVEELHVIMHDLLAAGITQINSSIKSIIFIANNEFFIKGLFINEEFQVVAMIKSFFLYGGTSRTT